MVSAKIGVEPSNTTLYVSASRRRFKKTKNNPTPSADELFTALRGMIRVLVKEVKLFKDKVQIYYNYNDRDKTDGTDKSDGKSETPDGDSHQGFLFYAFEKTFEIDKKKIGVKPEILTPQIEMYI